MVQLVQALRSKAKGRSRVRFLLVSFYWHNPSGLTTAPGSTQPLTEMNTGNISWGGGGGALG